MATPHLSFLFSDESVRLKGPSVRVAQFNQDGTQFQTVIEVHLQYPRCCSANICRSKDVAAIELEMFVPLVTPGIEEPHDLVVSGSRPVRFVPLLRLQWW